MDLPRERFNLFEMQCIESNYFFTANPLDLGTFHLVQSKKSGILQSAKNSQCDPIKYRILNEEFFNMFRSRHLNSRQSILEQYTLISVNFSRFQWISVNSSEFLLVQTVNWQWNTLKAQQNCTIARIISYWYLYYVHFGCGSAFWTFCRPMSHHLTIETTNTSWIINQMWLVHFRL